ncbi:hypothetical protein DFH07DRAFT_751222 [Mycena maculata]|uniref:Uncharacterized protein n=1 Tax=Mycena maculata TaxID=230809 RepID=A0AAD7IEC9_9AGAR|nr:hypothetical protein DFH07DRAFT_751222 [Mycena maculata]
MQLAKHNHPSDQIDALNEDLEESLEDLEVSTLSNVDIGSRLKPVSFSTIEQLMSENPAFERFRVKFGDFISTSYPRTATNYPMGNGNDLTVQTRYIIPFQFLLKVHYESLASWASTSDYLRCNPKFHGHPRYDCVLVQTEKDKFLRFHRVHANPWKSSEFISVHSIIRGTLIVQDFNKSGEFIVVDIADVDMSLRLKKMYPHHL